MSNDTTTISVIGGTGALGKGLVFRCASAGYRVTIGSRNVVNAEGVAAELNGRLGKELVGAADYRTVASASNIVILAVPYAAEMETVREIQPVLAGKILVDATAPLNPPKVSRVSLPQGGSAVASVQDFLGPDVHVVSAFQNVSAHKLQSDDPDIDCDVLVCGENDVARTTIIALISSFGLRGVDAGPICNSAAAEAMTSLLIWINRKYKSAGSGIRITGLD